MPKIILLLGLLLSWGGFSYFSPAERAPKLDLPYAEAGLTEREAAAHLLDRLAYGARPGEVDQLLEEGIENWLSEQLNPQEDRQLEAELRRKYPALGMTTQEIGKKYPSAGVKLIFGAMMLREEIAEADGDVQAVLRRRMGDMGGGMAAGPRNRDQLAEEAGQASQLNRILNVEELPGPEDQSQYARFTRLGQQLGFEPMEDLMYQLMAQKIDRAVQSENQLEEVLTDFWFNHFNVSITRVNDGAPHVLAYERDAIRPHVLGDFREMLGATARHPAMLIYLDNNRSNAAEGVETLMPTRSGEDLLQKRMGSDENSPISAAQLKQFMQQPGVNENYARELFELHTLGVDGGYTQRDIEEAARAFTGWKVDPRIYPLPKKLDRLVGLAGLRRKAVLRDAFYFDPGRHDAEEKVILGQRFPAGGGVEEGEQILDRVALHPSTAHHLATKLAVRFVNDAPPTELVDELAESFLRSEGDLKKVMITLVESEAFWASRTEKIRTPLEYVVSSVRALGQAPEHPRALAQWLTRMGQPLYAYQAPTGYPDEATQWTNGAALLNRMNFGLELARNQIPGLPVDVLSVNQGREPESPTAALDTYLPLLLPGRDHSETKELLLPVLNDPRFADKVAVAAGSQVMPDEAVVAPERESLARTVGLILGSPEFQRQ
ncbi:DUF1800 domain-containing protein [Lewinella sp. W8]|uniref:DUF1800 domain-containing protein n=1 Tax=Lewinella sp. W8 TaxID=2528208 RepID=UPI001563AA40|nr:DUF1800 domain-containing protein [Lewinella sp. W8]